MDRCSLELEREIADISGFSDENTAGHIVFYSRSTEADVIRSTLVEGTIGSLAIYSTHNKGQIDWWRVEVTGVEDLSKPSEDVAPRFKITLTNV